MEVEFNNARVPTVVEVKELIAAKTADKAFSEELGEVLVQPIGERGLLFRLKPIKAETHQKLLDVLNENFNPDAKAETKTDANKILPIEETKYESIGPVIGQELKRKTVWAIALAAVGIILYIAWAFRKVSKPVQSWKYGVGAVIALCHDVLITTGLFAVLGHFFGIEVDMLFVSALLTILGYSVNDTIVVYDRTRENLHRYQGFDFEDTVNRSINETLVRSLNTTITTELALVAVYLFGGESIRNFALALLFGIFFGAYSSIFIASALIVSWQKWSAKQRT